MIMNPAGRVDPITAERAMQVITSTVSSLQSDKDKLRKICAYVDAWVFEKPDPSLMGAV